MRYDQIQRARKLSKRRTKNQPANVALRRKWHGKKPRARKEG